MASQSTERKKDFCSVSRESLEDKKLFKKPKFQGPTPRGGGTRGQGSSYQPYAGYSRDMNAWEQNFPQTYQPTTQL